VSLEMYRTEAEAKRVEMEKQFSGLKLEVNHLNRFMEQEIMAHSCRPGIFPNVDSVSTVQSPRDAEDSLNCGHGAESNVPDTHALVCGMSPTKPIARGSECFVDSARTRLNGAFADSMRFNRGSLLKIQFLVFNGEDPQLWKSRYESYFEMYGVESSLWIKVSSMHLEGTAARSFKLAECRVYSMSWEEFCAQIHDRFGQDQHEALIRQLFHICQSRSVTDYVDRFSTLIDQLAAYETDVNPLYYATWFVHGLREDLKSVVMIHRSSTLNVVYALALVQEEATQSSKKRDFRRYDQTCAKLF
jgi:hypothetical protein